MCRRIDTTLLRILAFASVVLVASLAIAADDAHRRLPPPADFTTLRQAVLDHAPESVVRDADAGRYGPTVRVDLGRLLLDPAFPAHERVETILELLGGDVAQAALRRFRTASGSGEAPATRPARESAAVARQRRPSDPKRTHPPDDAAIVVEEMTLERPRDAEPNTTTSFEAFSRYRDAAAARKSGSTAGTWITQGPAPAVFGQTEGINSTGPGSNPVDGSIHTVITHPNDPDIALLGGANGGIWRTTNFTALNPTYVNTTDQQPSSSIGALEFDPFSAPDFDVVVAGIGRHSSFALEGGDQTGLLRSTDGGQTWTPLGLTDLAGRNVTGVGPRGNTILVAANGYGSTVGPGVYRTTDGGATFALISGTGGLPVGQAFDLVGDPTGDTNRFYVSIGSDGVYRTDDLGATWVNVSSSHAGLHAAMTAACNNNAEMAVAPTTGRVYVAVVCNGRLDYVAYSDSIGGSWTAMDLPATNDFEGTFSTSPRLKPGGQGAIHFSIIVDPSDATTVYIGGDRQPYGFPNSLGARDYTGRLFRGDTAVAPANPGELVVGSPQWEHLTHRQNLVFAGGGTADNSAPHADSRDLAFRADGVLVEVDDGGIYGRTSPRDNTGFWFSKLSDAAGGLTVTEMHDVAWDNVSRIIISGNQDTGTTEQISPGGLVYRSVSTADGGDVVVDTLVGGGRSVRYSSFQNLAVFRRRTVSASNAVLATAYPALAGRGGDFVPQFVTPLAVNDWAPNRLIIGAQNAVYESLDRGDTVTRIANGAIRSLWGKPIAYGARANPDALYVGIGSSIWRRFAAGALTAAAPIPGAGPLRAVALDPADDQTAYVADRDQIFRTTNGGASWTEITGNLRDVDIDFHDIEYVEGQGPVLDSIVVGARRGVHIMQVDPDTPWRLLGTGLPIVQVWDMDYDAKHDILVAGTLGRGAWTLRAVSCEGGDVDSDGDGVCDQLDICPNAPNPDQSDTDTDGDGAFDGCESDDDNDGVDDDDDPEPLDPTVCGIDDDGDTCDDCAGGGDGFGPLPNNDFTDDGPDDDGDGLCNDGDRLYFSPFTTTYVSGHGNIFPPRAYLIESPSSPITLFSAFLPNGKNLDALDVRGPDDLLFSVAQMTYVAGAWLEPDSIYHWDGANVTEVLDASDLGVNLGNFNALDELGDGTYAFSVSSTVWVTHTGGTLRLRPWEVWRLIPGIGTATLEPIADLSRFGAIDIDGVDRLKDGRLAFTIKDNDYWAGIGQVWNQVVYIVDPASDSIIESFGLMPADIGSIDGMTLIVDE